MVGILIRYIIISAVENFHLRRICVLISRKGPPRTLEQVLPIFVG